LMKYRSIIVFFELI